MKRIISACLLVFVLISMFTVMASAEAAAEIVPGEQVAKAIYGTPEIDGYADSIWDEAEIHILTHVYNNDEITEPTKIRFRSMWDEKYLYFLVEVVDTTMGDADWEGLSTGGNLWKRDSISFTFSPNYNRDVTATQEAPAFWFIIGAYGNTANWNNVSQNVFISEDEGVTKMYAISYNTDYSTNVNSGYTIEMKVNLAPQHADIKMEAGTKVGFDMYSNDNNYLLMSASRNYGLTWGGSVNSYKNDAEKGTVEFCAKDVKFENSEETLKWFPEAGETTAEPVETTTAPVEDVTTPEPEITTPEPEETTTPEPEETTTPAPVDTPPANDTTPADNDTTGGCGSVAAASAVVLAVAVLGGAVILNKKEN